MEEYRYFLIEPDYGALVYNYFLANLLMREGIKDPRSYMFWNRNQEKLG